MAYQALYRKWRPTTFSEVVAQEAVVQTLRNQVMSGRVAHAYLFCGSRGTGKTSLSKIVARAINCENPVNGDPCGVCESCKRLQGEESLDVMEIDAASNNGVDEIRDLRETVKYPPQHGKYKVYIIDEVHMLSASAFNALLKTLEEPPAHVVFILATTEPQRLPATILSRCQRFDFGRIPAQQIVERLQEAVKGADASATETALHMIARAAEGGMRDALSILDMCLGYRNQVDEALVHSVLGTSDKSFLFRFADALQNEDAPQLIGMIDELMRSGREAVVFSKDVSQHLRALLMAKCCGDELTGLLDVTIEDAEEYIGQASGFTETRLLSMLELFMAVETELRFASSPRIALESAALKACLRTGETDTAALLDRIATLEKQVVELEDKLKHGVTIAAQPTATPTANVKKSKAVQSAAPAAAEPKVLTPTGRNAEETWAEALKTLKKEEPSTLGFLQMGKFKGCQDQTYYWEAPEGQEIYVNALNTPAKMEAIEKALTHAAGVESHFHAGVTQKQSTVDQGEESYLDEMRKTFGQTNVLVQDEPK